MIDFRTQLIVSAQYKMGYDKITSGYYGILHLPNGSIAYHSNVSDRTLYDAENRVTKILESADNSIEAQLLQLYVDNHLGLEIAPHSPANDDKIVKKSSKIKVTESVANIKGKAFDDWNTWAEKIKKSRENFLEAA
jgi:hypothetical protein